jgi:5-methylcytosine-specific restriction endonuclease McrA
MKMKMKMKMKTSIHFKMSVIKRFNELVSISKEFPFIIDYVKEPIFLTQNGQSWNRRSAKINEKYKIVVIPDNKDIKNNCFRYDHSYDDLDTVINMIKNITKGYSTKISILIVLGIQDKESRNRQNFSKKVIEEIFDKDKRLCVFCGTKHNLVVDHKDDIYEGLNRKLKHSDGQLVCSHCNVVKRGGNSSKRSYRIPPPCLKNLRKYVCNSVDYWIDPSKWVKCINDHIEKKDKELRDKDLIIDEMKKEMRNKDLIIDEMKKEMRNKDLIIDEMKKEMRDKDLIIDEMKKEYNPRSIK